MKKTIAIVALLSVAAFAADDYISASLDITTSGSSSCVAVNPKTNYAIRCTQDSYVRASSDQTNLPAISKDPIAPQNKLYDIPTTATQKYICALQVSAAGTCYIYLHREKNE